MAWHIAAFQRSKRLPDLKQLYQDNSRKKRQSWRQQHEIMLAWSNDIARRKKLKEEKS